MRIARTAPRTPSTRLSTDDWSAAPLATEGGWLSPVRWSPFETGAPPARIVWLSAIAWPGASAARACWDSITWWPPKGSRPADVLWSSLLEWPGALATRRRWLSSTLWSPETCFALRIGLVLYPIETEHAVDVPFLLLGDKPRRIELRSLEYRREFLGVHHVMHKRVMIGGDRGFAQSHAQKEILGGHLAAF